MTYNEGNAKIIIYVEGKPEQLIDVGNCLTIGRSDHNDLMLPDKKVSRRHAEIRLVASGKYRLSDLGSANGTWLNDRRIKAPRDLQDGDLIQIGTTTLQFNQNKFFVQREENTTASHTVTHLANECVIVLVIDIRNYSSMTEGLPAEEFSQFIRRWFRESSDIIESHDGSVDKFMGDAVMSFWRVSSMENPASEIKKALKTAIALLNASEMFSQQFSAQFPGYIFQVGAGISLGYALLGNVGTAENQSITIVGDCVNVAFRLESLTKEKQKNIIVNSDLVAWAGSEFKFEALGEVEVKGRKNPVDICALIPD
jgi:adenylate cyclase